jgi:hypothetical protein
MKRWRVEAALEKKARERAEILEITRKNEEDAR